MKFCGVPSIGNMWYCSVIVMIENAAKHAHIYGIANSMAMSALFMSLFPLQIISKFTCFKYNFGQTSKNENVVIKQIQRAVNSARMTGRILPIKTVQFLY